MSNHYWYLATPYAKYPIGKHDAFIEACRQTALLLKSGIPVFSPIVHNHPLSLVKEMECVVGDSEFWITKVDLPMMHNAKGLIVCMMESWEESEGIKYERKFFAESGKPIIYLMPGEVETELKQFLTKEGVEA